MQSGLWDCTFPGVRLCLSGAGAMGVSIGNARVRERSCLPLFVVYLTRFGEVCIYLVLFTPGGVIVPVGPCLLCHSLAHTYRHPKSSSLVSSNTHKTIVVVKGESPIVTLQSHVIHRKPTSQSTCNTQPLSSWPSPAWPPPSPLPQPPAQQPHLPLVSTNPAAAKPLMRTKTSCH